MNKPTKAELIAKIRPGVIIRAYCDFIETPKHKYMVFLYVNFEDDESFVFLINSEIPHFISRDPHRMSGQVKLVRDPHYINLDHDSYLDCVTMFDCLQLPEMLDYLREYPEDIKGELRPEERAQLVEFVKISQSLNVDEKDIILKSLAN